MSTIALSARSRRAQSSTSFKRQQGVVLLFGLVALVIMLFGAVALMRSLNTSLYTAGNIAFKRDLANEAERIVPTILNAFDDAAGVLSTDAKRSAHLQSANYRASILPTNAQGIPQALLDDAQWAAVATNELTIADQGIRIRYLIDRLCDAEGLDTALGAQHCSLVTGTVATGGTRRQLLRAEDASSAGAAAVKQQVVYRVSIRVDGPRNTQSFFQTTLAQ